jgi:lactate dehydrogenase-like 2-hydroxyacid dehydrogenase
MKKKALYYEILQYQPESLELLHKNFDVFILRSPAEDTLEILADIDVLFAPLGFQVNRKKLDKCPRLKVVASNTTGHPHIDINCCLEKNISVACLKFEREFLETITPTAELTFCLILSLTRNVIASNRAVMEGVWDRRPFGAPKMLSRMRLGIVGLGRLGSLVAEYASSFRMQIGYFDPYVHSNEIHRFESLSELAHWSDVLTIHVPHEKQTENLVNHDVIASMKNGSYIVNTSRGELLDWRAAEKAILSKKLAGLATDVLENEFEMDFEKKFPKSDFLEFARNNSNVLVTPHIGGSTIDAWRETEIKTIQMAIDFVN